MTRTYRLACLSLAISFVICAAHGQESLRYKFEEGKKVFYDIKITSVFGDVREIREGTLVLNPLSVTDQLISLMPEGQLKTRRQSRDGSPVTVMNDFRFGPPVSDTILIRPAELSIDKSGELADIEIQTALPYMLGDFERIVLDDLPGKEIATTWKRTQDVTVVKNHQESPFPRMTRPPGFLPPTRFAPPGFRNDHNGTESRSAREDVEWMIESREKDAVHVTKRYSLKTDDKVNDRPRRQLTGEGEQTFDLNLGVWRSGLMRYQVEFHEDGVSVTIPVTLTFRLLSDSESRKRVELAARDTERASQAAERAREALRPKPFEPGERERLIEDLKSGEDRLIRRASDRLAKVPPSEKADTELAALLAQIATTTNGFSRAAIAKALAVWATPAQEKDFVKLLTSGDFMVRKPAIEGLAKIPTKSSARVLTESLKDLSTRHDAMKALKLMPPEFVEPEIIPLLTSDDVFTRNEAVKLLQEIGTSHSLDALKAFQKSGLPFAERYGQDAIRSIEMRRSVE